MSDCLKYNSAHSNMKVLLMPDSCNESLSMFKAQTFNISCNNDLMSVKARSAKADLK